MRCSLCSAEIDDNSEICAVCQRHVASDWLKCISRYILLPILLLIIAHYVLLFLFQLDILSIYMNLIYSTVALPFGYALFNRTRCHIAVACLAGLVVGVAAVTGMSAVVFLLLHQEFFPDKRHIQDFVEASVAIMLAYAAGSAIASLVHQLLPEMAVHRTFAESIRGLIALARGGPGHTIADRLLSLEAAIKALVAVALAVGTLVVAIKKLIL